jgi:hypothetical protein
MIRNNFPDNIHLAKKQNVYVAIKEQFNKNSHWSGLDVGRMETGRTGR